MKRTLSVLLTVAVLLVALLCVTSCGKKSGSTGTTTDPVTEPTTDPATEATGYTVTWDVDGTLSTSTVAPGETPVYPGEYAPFKNGDKTTAFKFVGWDNEPAPATSDVTYTAVFESGAAITVRWVLKHDVLTEYYLVGETPAFKGNPGCPLDYSAEYGYTFLKWTKDPQPLTDADLGAGKVSYVAKYEQYVRSYKATFVVNGEQTAEVVADYGKIPVYPSAAPEKSGMVFAGWDPPLWKITKDTTYTAVFGKADANGYYINMSPEWLTSALSTIDGMGAVRFKIKDAAGNIANNGQDTQPYNSMTATAYLALQEKYNPGSVTIRDYVVQQMNSLTAGGNEPSMDMGPYWGLAQACAAITAVHETPTLWGALSSEVQGKLDLIMRCYAVTCNFGMNDLNNYLTSFGMYGNYNKGWNPNYRYNNLLPMIYCAIYFKGADAVDAILTGFDYDAYMVELNNAGFTNIAAMFGEAGKDLMENGGTAYIKHEGYKDVGSACGSGVGCKVPFTYNGHRLDEAGLSAILNDLLAANHEGGVVASKLPIGAAEPDAYILNDKISPVEGLIGLYTEFNGGDSGGLRSSLSYCQEDFILGTTGLSMAIAYAGYDIETDMEKSLANKVWVGNTDFDFKCDVGYHDHKWSGNGDVRVDNYGGLRYTRDLWKNFILHYLDYDGEIGYTVNYIVGDVTTTSSYESATFTLEENNLPKGKVWFDGTRYYAGGAEITMETMGTLTLTAVTGCDDLDADARKLHDFGNTVIAPADASDNGTYAFEAKGGSLLSGRFLVEVTFAWPTDVPLANFSIQYKTTAAANPSVGILSGTSAGEIKAPDGTVLGTMTATRPLTVAYVFDTVNNTIKYWTLTEDGYVPMTAVPSDNAEHTVGRMFYVYVQKANAGKGITVSGSAFIGCGGPMLHPISNPAGDFDYNIVYKVDTAKYEQGSNDPAIVLDASAYLPAGHVWFDGSRYYAGGSTLTFGVKGKKTLTAVPGYSDIDADGATVVEGPTHSVMTTDGSNDATDQWNMTVGAVRMGIDLKVKLTAGTPVPSWWGLSYKHTTATNPATDLLWIGFDGDEPWYYAGCTAEETVVKIAPVVVGQEERFFVCYDTATGNNSVWHFEDGKFVLKVAFHAPNDAGTAGRYKYFRLPKSCVGSSVELDYTYYKGCFGPLNAPFEMPIPE